MRDSHRLRLLPSVFLICWSALNFAQFNTFSTMEDLDTNAEFNDHASPLNETTTPFFINSSESVGFEPNLEDKSVMVSLVWLSNVGFSMRALTKIHICSLILGSFIAAALFFF